MTRTDFILSILSSLLATTITTIARTAYRSNLHGKLINPLMVYYQRRKDKQYAELIGNICRYY